MKNQGIGQDGMGWEGVLESLCLGNSHGKSKCRIKKSAIRTARDGIPDWLICISGARGEDAAVCASGPCTHSVFLDKEPALNQGHPAQT